MVVVDEVDDEVGGHWEVVSVDPIGIVIHFWILEARPISDLILLLPSQHIRYATALTGCALLQLFLHLIVLLLSVKVFDAEIHCFSK